MFMDRKTPYSQDVSSSQLDVYIRCNPLTISADYFSDIKNIFPRCWAPTQGLTRVRRVLYHPRPRGHIPSPAANSLCRGQDPAHSAQSLLHWQTQRHLADPSATGASWNQCQFRAQVQRSLKVHHVPLPKVQPSWCCDLDSLTVSPKALPIGNLVPIVGM